MKIEVLENDESLKAPLIDLLWRANCDFVPPLSPRLNFDDYSDKLISQATIIAAFEDKSYLFGAVFLYAWEGYDYAFSSFLWVDKKYRDSFTGLLLKRAEHKFVRDKGMKGIRAKTWADNNDSVIEFYKNLGYKVSNPTYNSGLNRNEVNLELTF